MSDIIPPLLSMTSPLGPDALIPTGFGLEEALSQPFTGIIDMVSKQATIDPDKLLHQPVCVSLRGRHCRSPQGSWPGAAFRRHRPASGARRVRLPSGDRAALWFLSQTEDCRIFENKTTKDIVRPSCRTTGCPSCFAPQHTDPRPFTVQYNETDLDFVSRLLQEEGWFYFFSDTDAVGPEGQSVPAGDDDHFGSRHQPQQEGSRHGHARPRRGHRHARELAPGARHGLWQCRAR